MGTSSEETPRPTAKPDPRDSSSSRLDPETARLLNPYHSDGCEGCAGWVDLYEKTLDIVGERNVELARARNELAVAEVRVDLVSLDHARDRKEMGAKLVATNAVLDQYRNLVAGVWQTVQALLEPVAKAYGNLEAEMRRLAAPPEVQAEDWRAMAKTKESQMSSGYVYLHAPYGPGPRSGHLSLPGMVPGSAGERVVWCGPQCRAEHLYKGACLLTEYRTPEQEQRYPGPGASGDAQG
jgi:hypothetical protein